MGDILRFKKKFNFHSPCSEIDIVNIEDDLAIKLPDELKKILLETNGVEDEYGCELVWNCDDLIRKNRSLREYEEFKEQFMSFDSCLMFGEAGNGDQYFYPVLPNGATKSEILIWNHETDERVFFSCDFEQMFKRVIKENSE